MNSAGWFVWSMLGVVWYTLWHDYHKEDRENKTAQGGNVQRRK